MTRSNFQFNDPKTGKVVRFSADIPAPKKDPFVPVGGYNPGQVGVGKQARQVAAMTKMIPRKKFT